MVERGGGRGREENHGGGLHLQKRDLETDLELQDYTLPASATATTSMLTCMPTNASADPRYVPCSGIAWRGSRATATRTRSRVPTMPLVGSNSIQPALGR